jgi:hypothetical protein
MPSMLLRQPPKPVNDKLDSVTITDIENHKLLGTAELVRDLENVRKFDASVNKNSFAGNPFLYHFQLGNLLKCRRQDGQTIYDISADPEKWAKLIQYTRDKNRGGKTAAGNVYECFRINQGSVVMFKATTAKYLYKKYGAKHVLDPTAGWGGRMLGAWSLDIDYTGIDSNINMMFDYLLMMNFLRNVNSESRLRMIWKDCLEVNFREIDYDFVLTSPPYANLEMYEHMKGWESEEDFFVNFFMPLWQKSMIHVRRNGHVAFNISPKMYENAKKYGLKPCDAQEDLKQHLGQKMNKKSHDQIYVWKT